MASGKLIALPVIPEPRREGEEDEKEEEPQEPLIYPVHFIERRGSAYALSSPYVIERFRRAAVRLPKASYHS